MAIIGDILTTPESGWKRIDGSDLRIKYNGSWSRFAGSGGYWDNTIVYSSPNWEAITGSINFRFKGTQLRIILSSAGYPVGSNNKIIIDDVIYSLNAAPTGQKQYLLFEQLNLVDDIHNITIQIDNSSFGLDAIDIDNTGDLIGSIGAQLLQPEAGWKRYDDNDQRINYIGSWEYTNVTSHYGSSCHYTNITGRKIQFKFKGTQLRLISPINQGYSSNISIKIDGVETIFSEFDVSPSNIFQALVHEQLLLNDILHFVEITALDGNYVGLDAIDINTEGYLSHFYLTEKTKISEMEIGDVISCEYVAVSNTVGTFSNLGNATKTLIPPSSSATPNGSFYFIKVDENLLIADRVVQHSITWDKLHIGKMIEGQTHFDITPIMTSNNTPAPYIITTSSQYSADYAGWKAFNKINTGAFASWFTLSGTNTGWISIDLNQSTQIYSYSIRAHSSTDSSLLDRCPKTWNLEGSNNNIDWIVLDNQSNQVNWLHEELRQFNLNTSVSFRYYRLNILENNGGTYVGINELNLNGHEEPMLIRSLSGGCSYIDANGLLSGTSQNLGGFPNLNEWDRYIVNSDLNGKITKEDPSIWNHHRNVDTANGVPLSWCQDSMYNVTANRIVRGRYTQVASSSNYFDFIHNVSSTTINALNGFRPVLQLIDNKQTNFWR